MAEHKKNCIYGAVILILLAAIAGILFYMIPMRYHLNREVTYSPDMNLTGNPLTGFAPPAENISACSDSQLVFISLTWAEWEPMQGEFAISEMEEKFHIKKWTEENKHAVLRFVCDIPGEERHMDVPEWLAKKTGGVFYENAYGKGYSPDYDSDAFRACHRETLLALAKYCNQNDFVSYVELGSIGHWGEWHCIDTKGKNVMPGAETCWEIVSDYSANFENARCLMRRNYEMAAEAGLGLYNDMLGNETDTEEWLSWIRDGGEQETKEGSLVLLPIEQFWENSPVGGEFTSEYGYEQLLQDDLLKVLEQIDACHLSFIGPNCPTFSLSTSNGGNAVKKRLGYRIYISSLATRFDFAGNHLELKLKWENAGNAPFYWDWPVTVKVFNLQDELVFWEMLDLKLSDLKPGTEITTLTEIPYSEEISKGFSVGITITDYEENETITLAIDSGEEERKWIGDAQIICGQET